jgi:hypothetical protein
LADAIERLAAEAEQGRATSYRQFAAIHRQLSEAGYSPPDRSMISAVARSYAERAAKVRVLLVRSGRHDDPVTKVIEMEVDATDRLVAGHRLKRLGVRLSVIGETSPPQIISGPEHVVLDVPRGITLSGAEEPGLYLVTGLPPSAVLSAVP